MESIVLSSGEDFEDYCLRTFECFLQGDLFPYSLRETYRLVFTSWDEAVEKIEEEGVEGFTYQKSPDGDYNLCMHGFTQSVVMQDKSLGLLVSFCNTTYKLLVNMFDIPMRYETQRMTGDDGRQRIVHVPTGGYQPKTRNPRYSGIMESNGDLVAKVCYDRFLQKSGFTLSTAALAQAFGMPKEGLLCILQQNGIIVENEDDDSQWELSERLKGEGLTLPKKGLDSKEEELWTYKGGLYLYLLLTKDFNVRPCCEREEN